MEQIKIKTPNRNIEVTTENIGDFRKLLSFLEDLEDRKELEHAIKNDNSDTISFDDYDKQKHGKIV